MLSRLAASFLIAAAASCASPGERNDAVASSAGPEFSFTGSRIIGCCCPSPCPCRLNKKPSNCHGCDHTDAIHIDRGHIGDVKMDGVTYVTIGRGFGEDKSKNWVYVYVDDDASEEQVKALGEWLGGGVKSLGAKADYLAGKFVGMREVPMEYRVSKDRSEYDCLIPDVLELRTRALVNPGHHEPVVSTGIMDAFGDRFVHAECLAHVYKDATIGYEWNLTGRQCNQADFVLDNERIAKGGIGWGCWTAHSDFGDGQPYGEQLLQHP
jgi:hypothetical protein